MEERAPVIEAERPGVHEKARMEAESVGFCKSCRFWGVPSTGCPIVITTEEADDEHITPPDFGCVRWELIGEKANGA